MSAEGPFAPLEAPEGCPLVTDPDVLAGHEVDITGRFRGRASALARPRDRKGVAAIVAACARAGTPLVPQGGNTGLVGGAVPRDGEVVLSLAGLDRVGDVDPASCQVTVGAGVTLERVQELARAAGLEFPLDHPARASATIGGSVATDAGGAPALRHGTMRRRVVGLEAVLADGSVISRLDGLLKDNAGLDLPALLIGSEGTLGVLTAVRVQLEPGAGPRFVALIGLAGFEDGLELLARIRTVPGLEALDFFDAASMELVRERRGLRAPLPSAHGLYVVAQLAGTSEPAEDLAEALEPMPFATEVVAGEGSAEIERLWAYRERINESIAELGTPHKLDVAVPIARLPEFARAAAAATGGARLFLYGHLGDGNVHVNVLGPGPEDDAVDEAILRAACGLGGTISAEHGVGIAKRRYLPLCRSDAEITAMRALKRALDPDAILAPGRVIEP